MRNVMILSLADGSGRHGAGAGPTREAREAGTPARVPVRACADTLRAAGVRVEPVTAYEDADIDAALMTAERDGARLIVAAATDGQVRAVVRRMVRRMAPPPSKRPADLPTGRTVADLPPLGVLPLLPGTPDLVKRLSLPIDPADVAAATLAGRTKRFDLLRTDSGSVTLLGALVAGGDAGGSTVRWRGRVEVDDAVLTEGAEQVLACSVTNAGSSDVDGLPLVVNADPTDGLLDVAVAVPAIWRRPLRRPSVRFEVRRARGRAMSLTPRDAQLRFIDDGVAGVLTRRRGWWIEPALWAAYVL